jgi:Leucine-rich repeat (LRR) protein
VCSCTLYRAHPHGLHGSNTCFAKRYVEHSRCQPRWRLKSPVAALFKSPSSALCIASLHHPFLPASVLQTMTTTLLPSRTSPQLILSLTRPTTWARDSEWPGLAARNHTLISPAAGFSTFPMSWARRRCDPSVGQHNALAVDPTRSSLDRLHGCTYSSTRLQTLKHYFPLTSTNPRYLRLYNTKYTM